MPTYKKITLDNGLRILTVEDPHAVSATVMVVVGVGSRYEPENVAGISHFIEHNVFKGTFTRTDRNQVAEEIESVGGVTNAATSFEFTYYWAKAAAAKTSTILDIIMDISRNMTIPEHDLEIERGNVIEEIHMYEDNPMSRLGMHFSNFVWNNHPVGREIIGSEETVGAMSREDLLAFIKEHYTADRKLVVVSGNINHEEVVNQVRDYYHDLAPGTSKIETHPYTEFQTKPRVYLEKDETQQAHLIFGMKTFDRHDDRREILDVANAVLGQGLSGRLFRIIRDELGLAYYVGSSHSEVDDTGFWAARAGVDINRVHDAIDAIRLQFIRLRDEAVPEKELNKAKEYLKGKTMLGVETSDSLAEWYAFQELLEDDVLTPDEYNTKIDSVTADQIQSVVSDVLRDEMLNLGVIGPFEDREKFLEGLTFKD